MIKLPQTPLFDSFDDGTWDFQDPSQMDPNASGWDPSQVAQGDPSQVWNASGLYTTDAQGNPVLPSQPTAGPNGASSTSQVGMPGAPGGPSDTPGSLAQIQQAMQNPSLIQQLMSNPQGMANLSSVLSGLANTQNANRQTQGKFTQNYDQLMLNAAANRRSDISSALHNIAVASYLQNGGSHFKQPSIQLNGQVRATPDLGLAPAPASAAQQQAAATLMPQMEALLQPGGSYTPQPLNGYAKPGTLEQIAGYGSAGVGGVGAIGQMMNPNAGQPTITIPQIMGQQPQQQGPYGNTPPFVNGTQQIGQFNPMMS